MVKILIINFFVYKLFIIPTTSVSAKILASIAGSESNFSFNKFLDFSYLDGCILILFSGIRAS